MRSRAATIQTAIASSSATSTMSKMAVTLMCAALSARPRLPHQAGDKLRDDRAGELNEQPDADELEAAERPFDQRQQTEHDQSEAEIVRLRQRVQPRQRIRESATVLPCLPEKTTAPPQTATTVKISSARLIRGPALPAFCFQGRRALTTKATAANAARSASINATSTIAGVRRRHGKKQQHGDAAAAEQLRRHHAVGFGGTAENANQSQRNHHQHENGGADQKFIHCRAELPRLRSQCLRPQLPNASSAAN